MENKNLIRFLLTFFLGWIGSIVINHTELKPEGYTSRTLAYIFLTMVTFGIYGFVAPCVTLPLILQRERLSVTKRTKGIVNIARFVSVL